MTDLPSAQPTPGKTGADANSRGRETSQKMPIKPPHREFDIPDDIVDQLGPAPAQSPNGVRLFYALLRSFAAEYPPKSFSDWCDLWDRAVERYGVRRITVACGILVPLYRGRAKAEIVRLETRRFLPEPPFTDRSQDATPAEIDEKLGSLDESQLKSALEDLELEASAIDGLAYVLSQEKAQPLERLRQVKLTRERALERSLLRREQLRRSGPALPVQDAEFESVIDSCEASIHEEHPESGSD